jgi:hypothetical protein
MKSALPGWLRVLWICVSPLGLAFAGRIAWEKTVWVMTRGPQMVGFSLVHIHPLFFVSGVLCCYALVLWLMVAAVNLIVRRKSGISSFDIGMVLVAVFVIVVMLVPDNFFAAAR